MSAGEKRDLIYFVRNRTARLIKVGFTSNIDRRLRYLETQSGVELQRLGSVAGTRWHERAIHAELKNFRETGEWFRDCPEVVKVVDRIIEHGVEKSGIDLDIAGDPRRSRSDEIEEAIRIATLISKLSFGKSYSDIERDYGISGELIRKLRHRVLSTVSIEKFLHLQSVFLRVLDDAAAEIARERSHLVECMEGFAGIGDAIAHMEKIIKGQRGDGRCH